jgi:DNA repair protein RecN (Recombination protein N)
MLSALRLRDFVIVDDAQIEFSAGFNVLSGETGAGKSILIDALLLALGGRADASSVRDGASRADIVAEFTVDARVGRWLAERDLAGDEGVVLLRRVVDGDGRSRAFVNGHPSTATQLRELGEALVDIHGQHANQSLLKADAQRALLDAVAGLQSQAAEVARLHREWSVLARQLEDAEKRGRELSLERDRLEWQAGELAALRLSPGEWNELNVEHKRLSNAASLIEGARAAAEAVSEGDEAQASALSSLLARLKPLSQHDAQLAGPVELLESALIQLEEAGSTLARYAERVDLDPSRLDEVDRRMAAIHSTARKFRLSPEAIPTELAAIQARLAELVAAQDVDALRGRSEAALARYDSAARRLSEARRAAARPLEEQVTGHLQGLGMGGGRIAIVFEPQPPQASGIDRVEFLVAGHAGSAPRPLARIASGGELSRVSLAIAVMAAQGNPVPTLIFDEADAGVGGATAELIGPADAPPRRRPPGAVRHPPAPGGGAGARAFLGRQGSRAGRPHGQPHRAARPAAAGRGGGPDAGRRGDHLDDPTPRPRAAERGLAPSAA